MADDQDARTELLSELNGLPAVLKEITARFTINARARLAEITSALEGKGFAGEQPKPASKKKVKEMLAAVRKLKLKPDKGRGKDIARVERLLEQLVEIYPGKG